MKNMKNLNYSETIKNIRQTLKDYIQDSNLKSLVIGVSGGIDSALVCALAKPVVDELGIPLIGRSISIESNKEDEKERAKNIGKCFCSDFKEIDLTEQFLTLKTIDDNEGELDQDTINYKIRMGNIKARMRMIYLYNLSHKTSGMVMGTENKCEHYCSFFSRWGDEASDFEPIKNLWKYEVYEIAEYLANNGTQEEKEALLSCVECDATDGLGITNTDLDQILPDWKDRHTSTKTGYKEVDEIFIKYFDLLENLKTCNDDQKANIINSISILEESPVIIRYMKTHYKRNGTFVVGKENIIYN